MAIDLVDLKKSVVNNWVMSGKTQQQVETIIDAAISDGVGMFWKERPWSFTLKTDTFTLTPSATSYDCPTDCDGIIRMKLELASTPRDLVELPAHVFDEQFPYPSSLPTDNASYYKVEVNNGMMQIFVMPISGSSDTVRRTYKIKFKLDTALVLIPADYKYVIVSACLYQSVPSITPDGVRMTAYSEYRELVKRAENLDKTSYRKLAKIGQTQPNLVNRNSWQFFLGDDRWND